MKNPIFIIIQKQEIDFRNEFNLELKIATNSQKKYYFIEPKSKEQDVKFSAGELYTLENYHFSIYEDFRVEQGHAWASHHVTLDFICKDNTNKIKAHVYFDKLNNKSYVTLKSSMGDDNLPKSIQKQTLEVITQIARKCCLSFISLLYEIYNRLDDVAKNKYEDLLAELENYNKQADIAVSINIKQIAWQNYDNSLKLLLDHIEEWNTWDLQTKKGIINRFKDLSFKVKSTVAELDDERKVQLEKIQEQLNIFNDKKPTLSKFEQIIGEYNILLEKEKLLVESSETLACMVAIRYLEKEANKELADSLFKQKVFKTQDEIKNLEILIKMLPKVGLQHFFWAVNNKQSMVLKFLIKYHLHVNLNQPYQKNGPTLLEIAYNKNDFECFNLLLETGVYVDTLDRQHRTLLNRACVNQREEEMVALLKAGASNFIPYQGFTAFGWMTMAANSKPNINLLKKFIDNCPNFIIDYMQGPSNLRGTPFIFACQQGWEQVIKFYLQNGADPEATRETDHLSAVAVCAFKGHINLLDIIFEHFKSQQKKLSPECCSAALNIAKKYSQHAAKAKIRRYMKENEIQETDEVVLKLPQGASMNYISNIINDYC